jgi:hypothetical protein
MTGNSGPVRVGARILPDGVPDTGETLVLDRRQRDTLQALVMDLELGEWAACGFELDPEDHDAQQARRARVERAFAILDDLGWDTDDEREEFHLRLESRDGLIDALLQWREWQIHAIEDIHADRKAGVPTSETAPALLQAAERLGVVAGLLQRL